MLSGSGFCMLRRYLTCRLGEVYRVYWLPGGAADGCPGLGPAHLLLESAAEIGFHWSLLRLDGLGEGGQF